MRVSIIRLLVALIVFIAAVSGQTTPVPTDVITPTTAGAVATATATAAGAAA